MRFYDLQSSKKAYQEILYNFEKLLNIFEREKFSVTFAENKEEIFEKFYLVQYFIISEIDSKSF